MSDVATTAKPPTAAQTEWVARVLGIAVAAAPAPKMVGPRPAKPAASSDPGLEGMALWSAERARALGSLKQLESLIRDSLSPEKDEAIILLRAAQANLTAEPATLRQVEELQRYIDSDDIVATAEGPNNFGIKVELRAPLTKALASLRAQHVRTGS